MMFKDFIRKDLLDSGYGVYPKILEVYSKEMTFLETPSRFRRWLATELEVPIEKINLSSLNSALQQQRKKKQNMKVTPGKQEADLSKAGYPESKIEGFKFSKPGSDDEKASRITEM
ncbi:hypothetical protein [Niabella aquatica]